MLQNIQTMSDLTNFLNTLSYNDFKKIVELSLLNLQILY